jgi:lipoate-protein ligase A
MIDRRRPWRLLVTEATDGATNMAIDEALWCSRQTGEVPPTLRFFAWDPPTVSLGYGQPLDDAVSVETARRLGVGMVRRPTGGSAIYHDGPERELTYTVVATNEDLGVTTDLLDAYRWIARALARGLRDLGVPAEIVATPRAKGSAPAFCFARTGRYEIELDGKKLVGSAQRRRGRCFLQHGSVLLGADAPRLRALFPTTVDPMASMTTLEAALGRRPPFEEVAAALGAAFETEHGLTLRPGGLSWEEDALVGQLVADKYATDAWLAGPASEERHGFAGALRASGGLGGPVARPPM